MKPIEYIYPRINVPYNRNLCNKIILPRLIVFLYPPKKGLGLKKVIYPYLGLIT